MNSTGRVWARIRRIAASDRISGLIMLAFAFAGLVLANLPWTSHMFEAVAETQLGIPGTNIILPIGHWAQDGLLCFIGGEQLESRFARQLDVHAQAV